MSSLKISRILHAGYVFQCNNTQIAFDPIFENPFSKNCYAFPAVKFDESAIRDLKLDAVFISHHHDDHCSLESLNLLRRETPIYIYCIHEELLEMIRELGFKRVVALEIDKPVTVGEITVTPRRALDEDVDSLFQIEAAGLNVLNVVDSWIDKATLRELAQFKWDMILWPFQTMREIEVIAPERAKSLPAELPPEWLEQLKILNPRYIVPSSCQFKQEDWSWYNHAFFPISYKQFQCVIERLLPDSQVVRLNPSISVELSSESLKTSQALLWVHPIGDQSLDYEFTPNYPPPPTSDVARHFAVLTAKEDIRVNKFCTSDLIEKYNSLHLEGDSYFDTPRVWQLAVFRADGIATNYFYQVHRGWIIALEKRANPDWVTEVPAAKLYGALENGESLTSMYVRINPANFEDIVEDPLIATLFTGVFGAYQRAQLERLRTRD